MNNKIIITGAAGFIGFHLSKSLLNDGYDVYGIDNLNDYYSPILKHKRLELLKKYKNFNFEEIDIKDRCSLEKTFHYFKPNKVVNLAAQAGVRYSIENPYVYIDSNIVGFLNILELCRHQNIDGLIYASSSSVYGGNKNIPFSIDDRVDNPVSLYAATKKTNELMAKAYSNLYGIHTTGLRFFTVYGPWGRPDMAMYIFVNNIINNIPIKVFNHGKMKRDFTYIEDIISGTRAAIDKNYSCEVFNLGNKKSEKLMYLVELIENELALKAKVNFLPMQPGDVKESFADIKESEIKLDYSPQTSIDKGIPKFINWYKEYTKYT